MGGRHHQKYKDVKQINKNKAGLKISCRIEQLIKEWHGQIIDGLVFLHETEHPKHEQFSQMINGLVAHVELEHEIVKWISSITNSLALTCNTIRKRCSVASNGQGNVEQTAYAQTVQHCVKWLSVMQNGTVYTQMVQRCSQNQKRDFSSRRLVSNSRHAR